MQWMYMLWTFLTVKYGYVFAITCRMSDTISQFFERSSVSLSKPILKYESALNIDDFDEYIKEF